MKARGFSLKAGGKRDGEKYAPRKHALTVSLALKKIWGHSAHYLTHKILSF